MAVVAWRAGGLMAPQTGRRTTVAQPGGELSDEPVVPIDAGTSMGSGRGVRVSRDAVAVVDGTTVTYRAYEASWESQTPLPSSSVDERRLHTETFQLLLFHRKPTPDEPRPPAVEGPDTTRVTATEADLDMRADAGLRAELAGDVEIVRHDVDEDLTLRTSALDLERVEHSQGAEEIHASSDVEVVVDGRAAHLVGTGLEADLGRRTSNQEGSPARVTILRDVVATLVARRGALTGQGGLEPEEATPVNISCSGAAELLELERGGKRQPSRWLATFQDDVVVAQAPTALHCQTLEIEFRMAAAGGDDSVEVLRAIADGDVIMSGADETLGDTWSLRCARSETRRDAKGGYSVDLEGGTLLAFDGTLRGRGNAGQDGEAERGRVEVRCSGLATIQTDPAPLRPDTPVRSRITFRDDVIARQWDGAGAVETEIRAAEVMLLGNRGTSGDGRLDVDTLTATGDEAERAFVQRESLTARARGITWRVLRESDIERLMLSGRPALRFDGASGMNLTGAAANVPATLLLDAEERVEITWRHTPPADMKLPEGQPHITALARQNVVVRRLVDERETYRMESQALDTTLDIELQPITFRAYGDVVVTGRGERDGDRQVELRGDRLSAQRRQADTSEWVRSDVFVFGQELALATALIREPAASDGTVGPEHLVSAEQLRYEQGGSLVSAKRNASVAIERLASDGARSAVTVRGKELRAYLNPPEDPQAGAPALLRVEGEGGVELVTDAYKVVGSTLIYDRVSGIATATGRPARGILRHVGKEDLGVELESFVASESIRAEFDPTSASPGRPRRVTCQGGTIRSFQFSGDEGQEQQLARITLRAKGPIEVLGDTATAEQDVELAWESKDPTTSRMREDARLLCERAELNFDTTATGSGRDRVKSAVAVGSRRRPAQLFSPTLDATADRVEAAGPWIELLSPWGTRVTVRRKEPAESFTCEKGRYNYVTQEFKATRARAEER